MKAFFAALFFALAATSPARAVQASVQRETYKDLILKARNLSLQKDRLQATKILARASMKEKGAGKKELVQALRELSEIFYSDKGQQIFELGRSLESTSPQVAVEHYNEALSLEPNNTTVLRALARACLALSNCECGQETAVRGLSINPFDEELLALKDRGGLCLNKPVPKKDGGGA